MSVASEMQRIADALDAVSAGKADIADAITAKGVPTLTDSTFAELAANVGLIEGGGGVPGVSYTSVSYVPDGRKFSINTDYDICVIVLDFHTTDIVAAGTAIGYNRQVKNIAGTVAWLPAPNHATAIIVDNTALKIRHIGDDTAFRYGQANLSERALNIQPHWLNGSYQVLGGYYTIGINR